MNQLQFETSIGIFVFSWNFNDLLTSVQWFERHDDVSRPGLFFNTRKVPHHIMQLSKQFEQYVKTGSPILDLDFNTFDLSTTTSFQKKVYEATVRIPIGETRSYTWVASRSGHPLACRAVGQALKKNPFPILIPCHRVISSEGSLGGFMGQHNPELPELRFKSRLLTLEREYLNPVFSFLLEPA